MHKKGTIGWIREQKQKKELNVTESKSEVVDDNDLLKIENRVKCKVQCKICDVYFVTDLEMDDDICNDCWPLVNSK